MAVPAVQLQEELELSVRREEAPLTEEVLVGEVSHTPPAAHTHTHWLTASETVCAETATGSESYPPPQKKTTERRCVQVTVPEGGVAWTGCRWRAGEGRCDVQTAAAGRGAHLQRALSEDELESCRLETDSVIVWRVRSSKWQKNTLPHLYFHELNMVLFWKYPHLKYLQPPQNNVKYCNRNTNLKTT